MTKNTRRYTPAQLELLAKVAISKDGYPAKNGAEYRRLKALEAHGLIEAVSWRVSYAGRAALDAIGDTASPERTSPHEIQAGRPVGELSDVNLDRLMRAWSIIFEDWEENDPVFREVADQLRASSKPVRETLEENPEAADYIAAKAAWLKAESDDEAQQIASKLAGRLRGEPSKLPEGKQKGKSRAAKT